MKKIKKEFRLHPALLFFCLTILIMIVSSIGGILHLETSYYTVNSVTGNLESKIIVINNLFNRSGIQYLISNMISNFTSFAPLGNLIVGLLGVGVAYKSGYLNSLFGLLSKKISKKTFTFIVVLLGILSSMFFEVGYVILIPVAAILFMNLGRHPSTGVCAAFAGITFGYGANIVVNGLDSMLSSYTGLAASILDKTYKVNLSGNLIFMIVSTICIAYLGMIVTEKYIVPKLGRYVFDESEYFDAMIVTKKEKKGVFIALLSSLLFVLILIYSIIPGLPFSGLFLYLKDSLYVNQLFGDNSYFSQGVVFLFSLLLIISGLVYGLRVKTLKNNKDLVDAMSYYLKDVASILVLIFFASQFCAIFKQTNIGVFIVSSLTELLNSIEVSGILLVILFFIITMISTMFIPASSTKWAILSPVVVPMFMQSSLTPEFAQAVFRAADSAVKGISPLFTYFVIFLGFLQIYNKKKDNAVTLTDAVSLMMPYAIFYSILWFVIILAFYIIGIPIGIGTGVMLPTA